MINVALVGCAHIHTPSFVKRLKARTDASVLAVWDHDAARAAKNAAECGAPAVADLAQVLGDPRIQAVVVCAETNRHAEVVLAAAAAKKHLFVEKPLGFAAADAAKMAKAIRKAGVLFQTGYFMRGDPIHLFLKDAIAKGWFGRITRARHSNCHSGSLGGWFDTEWRWMADPSIAGCGAYGDLGTHSLDILMWLFGDEVARVTATTHAVTRRYDACDETGEGILEFASGVTATLAGAWLDVANPVRLLVSGTEGHACVMNGQLFFLSKRVEGTDGKQPWTALPAGAPHAFELFLDAVAGKPTPIPLVTVEEAAARSAVMAALYEASAKGKWVKPKYRTALR
jgi:predicted dehydrogenase